jgi:hypothetical protein
VEVSRKRDRADSIATYYIGGELIPFEKKPGLFSMFGVVRRYSRTALIPGLHRGLHTGAARRRRTDRHGAVRMEMVLLYQSSVGPKAGMADAQYRRTCVSPSFVDIA